MPAEQSSQGQLVAEVAVLLGAKNGAPPDGVTRDSLAALTQRQLVSASKRLGLVAVSKLKKDELAVQVWAAWNALLAQAAAPAAAKVDGIAAAATVTAPPQRGNGTHNGQTRSGGAAGASVATAAAADGEPAETVPPRSHKFEVGEADRATSAAADQQSRAVAREIPWGYGHDRVTAMPIDPDRLYAYWEVLDDSIERARAQLGRGGPGAWLNLRVYDVTGRIFDGTNAHGNFDHRIERGDRQWFFPINKPTSELIVELGLKSDEGYFVKIARSGRVQFPRREPVGSVDPEWLTVRVSSGQVERGYGQPGRAGRPVGPVGGPAAIPAAAWDGVGGARGEGAAGHLRRVPDATMLTAVPPGAHTMTWEEVGADGTVEVHRQFRWEGPTVRTSWEAGPFSHPVEVPEPLHETTVGKTRVFRLGTHTHVVYGPWQVTIRGLGAEQARSVLSRWEVYRSWGEETGHEVEEFGTTLAADPAGGSERMVGSSGRRWVGSSELRFAGSSEQYFLKASELRLGGASERLLAGASEWRARGASERRLGGSSELRLGGASETGARGASERLFAAGSDRWARPALPAEVRPATVEGGAGGTSLPSSLPMSPSGEPASGASAYPPPPSGTPGLTPTWRKGS